MADQLQDIGERLLDFAVRVGQIVDSLPDSRLGRHVAGQLVRSGTSPCPNYEEACAAESKADFVHKLRICLKELRETWMWLRFIVKSGLLPPVKLTGVINEADQLKRIIGKSIVTANNNRKAQRP